MRPESVAVVGLGHVGSVISGCWASLGVRVVGLDTDARVVAGLQAGRAPIFEPGLDDLIRERVEAGCLAFTTEVGPAVAGADVVFLALDTPVDEDDRPDLAPIERWIHAVRPHLGAGATVVVHSQVPVGTCARWRDEVGSRRNGAALALAYVPENLRLGDAIRSYLHPARTVVGADDEPTRRRVADLFSGFGAPIVPMSLGSAEMAKHALNGFLATSVSFINEIAGLCEASGADVLAVVDALKSDPRIGGSAFLTPGLGFAGGTLARDVQALRALGRQGTVETPLLDGVLAVNRGRPALVLRRLREACGPVDGLVIAALGLTYKAGTSTLRRSVALEVIRGLVAAGARVRAFDPRADLSELAAPAGFEPAGDAYDAVAHASALVVLTEWPEFAQLDFDRVQRAMARPLILDTKNLLAGLRLGERGFRYLGVGR